MNERDGKPSWTVEPADWMPWRALIWLLLAFKVAPAAVARIIKLILMVILWLLMILLILWLLGGVNPSPAAQVANQHRVR